MDIYALKGFDDNSPVIKALITGELKYERLSRNPKTYHEATKLKQELDRLWDEFAML